MYVFCYDRVHFTSLFSYFDLLWVRISLFKDSHELGVHSGLYILTLLFSMVRLKKAQSCIMQPSFAHSVCNARPHPVRRCSPLSSPSCTHCFAYSRAFNAYGDNQTRANKAPKILYCCQFFRPSSVLSLFKQGRDQFVCTSISVYSFN